MLLSTIRSLHTKKVLPIPKGIGNRVVGRVTKGRYSDKDFERDVVLVTGGDVIEGYETIELR